MYSRLIRLVVCTIQNSRKKEKRKGGRKEEVKKKHNEWYKGSRDEGTSVHLSFLLNFSLI
jgi:hypothetical protein